MGDIYSATLPVPFSGDRVPSLTVHTEVSVIDSADLDSLVNAYLLANPITLRHYVMSIDYATAQFANNVIEYSAFITELTFDA